MLNLLKRILIIRNVFYLYNFITTFIIKKNYKNDNIRKNLTIKKYSRLINANIFFETGSYLGDTLGKNSNSFKKLYSIEIFKDNYLFCKNRFKNDKKINLFLGNSVDVMPKILREIERNESITFWLDSHYDGGLTGGSNNPILDELKIIHKFGFSKSAILIDDYDDFGIKESYPSKDELMSVFKEYFPNKKIIIDNTIFIGI